jgi:four helix bundle protein
MKITSHKELRVWQEAMDLAMEVFALTRRFPTDERFSLVDQIRRSSRSVAANVAEAWRKRRYEAAFIAKLNDSEGEAAETQTHLEIALRCGYLEASVVGAVDERYERLLAQLVTMSTHPEVWVVAPREQKKMGTGGKETMRQEPSFLKVPTSQSPPSFPYQSPQVS